MLKKTKLVLVLVFVSLAAGLSSCRAHSGTAASVNGVRITYKQLDDFSRTKYAQNYSTDKLLMQLIQNEVGRLAFQGKNVLVSPQEREERLREDLQLGDDYEVEPVLLKCFDALLLKSDLTRSDIVNLIEDYRETFAKTKIDINPRYGVYDVDNVVVPHTYKWLAHKANTSQRTVNS